METLLFKVADLCFALHAPQTQILKRLLPSYAPFNIEKADGKIMLNAFVENGRVSAEPEGEELGQFDCGGTNHGIYKYNTGYKIIISTIEGHLASAMIANNDFSKCEISLFGNESDQQFGLGNAMMIAFAFSAAYYDTLLMHSSVTINDGYGYLFLGKSGTGKSTHSSLWRTYIQGSDLLNDDNPAVRVKGENEIIVYGTPWSGKTPCYRNLQYPIGAFVRLEQHPQNIIAKESPLKAFASIISSCSTMIWDKPSYAHIMHTAEAVAKKIAVYYLKCRADEEAAKLSYQTISKH